MKQKELAVSFEESSIKSKNENHV